MAVSENTGGTQTAVIGTEHVLATITAAGVYQLVVDTRNMVNGDVLELRTYLAVRSGESRRLARIDRYGDRQGDGAADTAAKGEVVKFSIPYTSVFGIRFALKQTAGTGRSFVWSVWQQ
ncbi:MAG: hypothetical protein A2148_12485 [Chloroflexi bacterium RBG_16_68_14]|nr:MAG: hypothetical protein A2148_12485 [Chloroflexi bacterium RBG_16_68_14]